MTKKASTFLKKLVRPLPITLRCITETYDWTANLEDGEEQSWIESLNRDPKKEQQLLIR